MMPSSAYQATLSPGSFGVRLGSGTGTTPESTPSGPIRRGRVRARSETYRAIGPTWLRGSLRPPGSAYAPVAGTRPAAGLRAAMPQEWAGVRRRPPQALPTPSGEPPAAMIEALPLPPPPGDRLMRYGFPVPP